METGDIMQMVDADAGKIVDQINEKLAAVPVWPFVAGIGIAVAVLLWHQYPASGQYAGAAALVALGLTLLALWRDNIRRKVVLLYDLDGAAAIAFERLTGTLDDIRSAAAIWNIDTHGATDDWKRHAGATHLLERRRARIEYTTPKVIETNVSVPAVVGGRQGLYFFPDLLLVMEGNRIGWIKYIDLILENDYTRFIEGARPPSDATVVDYTWRYVNKSGGPDRRFAGNRQLPICLYQTVQFGSSSGLSKLLYISRAGDEGERVRCAVAALSHAVEMDLPGPSRPRAAPGDKAGHQPDVPITAEMPNLIDLEPFLRLLGGEPGSATKRQLAAVRALRMGEPGNLSLEQASALLSARSYAEGVLYRLIGTTGGYPGERFVEAKLVDFIVRDADLFSRVLTWGRHSYARGGGHEISIPMRDAYYERVERTARRLLRLAA